ncbi:MAG TPA: SCO family protein [Candidatus Koribacter sp.]
MFTTACTHKPTRQYELQGKVITVDRTTHSLTIEHQDVPGLMKGMTMPFRVKDDWVLDAAHPGDDVTATLVISGDSSHLENVVLTETGNPAPSEAGVHVPQIGDAVPDFVFTNQDGKKLHIAQFRGKAVLLTFIYTRCPLPDYCIRMSRNFSDIARQLKQQPALYDKTMQLSVSFDPQYDTPKVLHEYGSNYAGEVDPKFTHWEFVSATPDETKKAADFFGLSYFPGGIGDAGQIVHTLRTVVIGPDGKITHLFSGNEWKPADGFAAIQSTLQ